jgi:hypothetical protein
MLFYTLFLVRALKNQDLPGIKGEIAPFAAER